MKKSLKNLACYPPAETEIPLRALLSALFSKSSNFEKTLCNYLGVHRCILGNTGKSLLYMLLIALKKADKGRCDEVLIPGYTCYSVAASVARAGLKIRVYDIDPQTLGPDIDSSIKAVSNRTLAVIGQHLFGIPTPLDGLKKIAQETGACFIEDAAQALGGTLNGQPVGTIGDFGFYSFGRGKPLPLGCGGALIGKNDHILSGIDLKPRTIGYASLISTALIQAMSKPSLYWIPEALPLGLGETIFDPGFDVGAMPHLCQRLAQESMTLLEGLNAHRRHIAKTYQNGFEHTCTIPVPENGSAVYTRFPLMAGPGGIPGELKRLGIRRMYPKAIADEKTIKPYLANQRFSTPGACEIAQNLITLPTHKRITKTRAGDIISKVNTKFFT